MSGETILSPLNLAKGDKFRISIIPPAGISSKLTSVYSSQPKAINLKSFVFNVSEVKIPDFSVPETKVDFAGGELHVSSHARESEDALTFSFELDSLLLNYTAIYTWLDTLCDDETGLFDEKKVLTERLTPGQENSLYAGEIIITMLDEYEKPIGEFRFLKAFPIKLGGPNLNYRATGEQVLKQEASFKYARFTWRPKFSID